MCVNRDAEQPKCKGAGQCGQKSQTDCAYERAISLKRRRAEEAATEASGAMEPRAAVEKSFVEQYQLGLVDAAAADDFVDKWHREPGSRTLAQYLGFTDAQYARWLLDPADLPEILTEA